LSQVDQASLLAASSDPGTLFFLQQMLSLYKDRALHVISHFLIAPYVSSLWASHRQSMKLFLLQHKSLANHPPLYLPHFWPGVKHVDMADTLLISISGLFIIAHVPSLIVAVTVSTLTNFPLPIHLHKLNPLPV
jgi:hypothetical protein